MEYNIGMTYATFSYDPSNLRSSLQLTIPLIHQGLQEPPNPCAWHPSKL